MGASTNHPLVLLILGLAAMIEYVVPPFPGDTITLLGAVLVSAYDWNLALVFLALMLGSLVGSALAYALGRRWARTQLVTGNPRLARLVARFERHGVWLLAINRFLPGIRPLFFVAAGLAKMPAGLVLLVSAVSAGLWNALLMILGASVGKNLGAIESWFRTYTTIAWLVLASCALVAVITIIVRRRSAAARA